MVRLTVVVGFDERLSATERVNSAQILAPGKSVRRYFKRHMVPGLELGYTLGKESFVDGTRGVAICKDMVCAVTTRAAASAARSGSPAIRALSFSVVTSCHPSVSARASRSRASSLL